MLVLALVDLLNLLLEKLDVKITYLHGDLDQEIYMEQLEGFFQNHKVNWFASSNSHCMA